MNHVISETVILNRWDRLSGVLMDIDHAVGVLRLRLRRRQAVAINVKFSTKTRITTNTGRLTAAELTKGMDTVVLGIFHEQSLIAVSIWVGDSSGTCSARPIEPIQPPSISCRLLDSGRIIVRQFGSGNGEEIVLESYDELHMLLRDPNALRDRFSGSAAFGGLQTNPQRLNYLLSRGGISMRDGAFLKSQPPWPAAPVPYSRFEGMMLGLAIGDSLGNTTESLRPTERKKRYGEIRDYLPHPKMGDKRGYPSDDTQMAFWTLDELLRSGSLAPRKLAQRFTEERIFGIGSAVKQFIITHKEGSPWEKCGSHSAGNGALMRIAPVLLPHMRCPTSDIWADAALAAMITHNDSAAIASSVAYLSVLWRCLQMAKSPEPIWWLEHFIGVLRDLETGDLYRSRSPSLAGFHGTIWQFLDQHVRRAHEDGVPVLAAFHWYSGAYVLETVACLLFILMRYGHDPEEAMIRAVNDTKDNDTIASLVGAVMGALYGRDALPARWVVALSGRTGADDDGEIFRLLERAKAMWPLAGCE